MASALENIASTSTRKRPSGHKALSLEEKKIVLNVFDNLRKDFVSLSVDEIATKYETYIGVSKQTVYNIIKEDTVIGEVLHPKKPPGRNKTFIEIWVKNVIRQSTMPKMRMCMKAVLDASCPNQITKTAHMKMHDALEKAVKGDCDALNAA